MKSPLLLVIASVLLVCAIALAAFVKPFINGFEKFGKKPLFTGLMIAIATALFGVLILYLFKDQPFTIYWMLAVLFLLFSVIQVALTHRRFFSDYQVSRYQTLTGEFFYTAAVAFFAASVLMFTELLLLKYPGFLFFPVLLSFIAFFIPPLFVTTFYEAISIPPSYFPVLEYPEVSKESPDDNPNERLLVIGFELAKKATETRSYFRARTPDDILLGDLFYFFINDYNESQSETPIQFKDELNHSYKWWFRLKPKWYQAERVLDPAQSMKENNVVENSIIICERL